MDINHIELSHLALASLYKGHLVESVPAAPVTAGNSAAPPDPAPRVPDPAAISVPPAPVTFKSLGSNQQNTLILVNQPDVVFLPDQSLKFLTGILTACKLSLADVAIVNLHSYSGSSYKELLSFFNSKKVLLFGVEPAGIQLPLNFPAFQSQAFNGCTYIWAPELSVMENDRIQKTQLWNSLKLLFNI